MLHEEVVLLDSDDEDTKAGIIRIDSTSASIPKNDQKNSIIADDIVAEYNHNDYADLLGHTNSVPHHSAVPKTSIPSTQPPTPTAKQVKVPKRPGAMPPFALFSQETRENLIKENPGMGFGDIGRTLGEMWHALKEEDKADYRRRAKEVGEAKMKSWQETMEAQKQKMSPMKMKKTSGYAIFCAEYRKKHPEMTSDSSQFYREARSAWAQCSQEARNGYEEKAQRENIEEERKFGAHRQMMQQAGIPSHSGRVLGGTQYHQQAYRPRGRGTRGYGHNTNQNPSPLRIASVSSMSTTETSNISGMNLPSGLSIEKTGRNIPSGISRPGRGMHTINRGSRPGPRPGSGTRPLPGSGPWPGPRLGPGLGTGPRSGPGPGMRGMRVRSRGAMRPTGSVMRARGSGPAYTNHIRPSMQAMRMQRGRGMMNSLRPLSMTPPLKRMNQTGSSLMSGIQPVKRMRMTGPTSVTPNTNMLSLNAICRVCGNQRPGNNKLSDNPVIIKMIDEMLNMAIDLEKDALEGYPDTICKQCRTLLETMFSFKVAVTQGQMLLKEKVEMLKKTNTANGIIDNFEEESIGVDPLEHSMNNPSVPMIIPDSEMMDKNVLNMKIKQESVKGPIETSRITNASSEPITALFTSSEGVSSIKSEPFSENLQYIENIESSKPEENPINHRENVLINGNHIEDSNMDTETIGNEQQSLKGIHHNSENSTADTEKMAEGQDNTEEKVIEEENLTNSISVNGLSYDEEDGNANYVNEEEAITHDFNDPLVEDIYEDATEGLYDKEVNGNIDMISGNGNLDTFDIQDNPIVDEESGDNQEMPDTNKLDNLEMEFNLPTIENVEGAANVESEELNVDDALDISEESGLEENRIGLISDFEQEGEDRRQS